MEMETVTQSTAVKSLSAFHLAKYRFTLRATTAIALPLYKGSATHGGFGHAMRHIAPAFFDIFYHPSGQGAPPKPFVLTPPLETKTEYRPGELFTLELVLIGNATQHLPVCFAAFDSLGQQLGFGTNKGHYQIERVDYSDSHGTFHPLYSAGQWQFSHTTISASQIAQQPAKTTERITLKLQTRLRLKHNGQLLKTSPSFELLLNRLLGRLTTLANFYQQDSLLPRETRNELLAAAKKIEVIEDNTHWDDWNRYSGRQKEWMKFGGLLGEISYEGDLTPFMPYLRLGEWLHLGGKTSFGLGKYRLTTNDS